jgi:hypothetical protein
MPSPHKKIPDKPEVSGKVVSSVPGFVLVKQASTKASVRQAPLSERAGTLVPKIAKALSRPGISRDAVFKGKTRNVYSYSVDPTDTTRVVRVSADGRRTVGRLVGERFLPLKIS